MKCSNCGHDNINESRFCNHCGSPMDGKKISLGRYSDQEGGRSPFFKKSKKELQIVDDESSPFNQMSIDEKNRQEQQDEIYDRDTRKSKERRPLFLRFVLVCILAIFIITAFYGVKFAVSTQDKRITQAELKKVQQAEAEELQRLENYREKFSSVISSYEEQGALIEENINGLTTLRINRFAQGLGLGNGFNNIVNQLFDVSKINDLKDQDSTLDVLVGELKDPPDTFETKYETLLLLQEISNDIIKNLSGEITAETKLDLESLNENYSKLLTDLKR